MFSQETILVLATIAAIVSLIWAVYIYFAGSRRYSRPVRIRIRRSEYVHFVEYPRWQWGLPWSIPRHSFLRGKKHIRQLHIPEGEIAIDFTVTNEHRTVVTNGIFIEVIEHEDLPKGVRFSGVRPVLDPFEDSALINSEQRQYSLFKDRNFSLQDGDADLLRVNVLIANSEFPAIFKLRLRIDHLSGSKRFASYSRPFYLAKYFGGHTNRNPYTHGYKRLDNWSELDNSIQSSLKPELFCTGRYQHTYMDEGDLQRLSPRDCVTYLQSHFEQVLLAGQRIPVQQYGFVKNELPVDERLLIRGSSTFHDSMEDVTVFSYSDGVPDSEYVWIYEGQKSEEYKNLQIAVRRIAIHGTKDEQVDAIEFLVETSYDPRVDIAADLDIISLLGLFPSSVSYDRIVGYLSSQNPIIQDRAAQMLSHTRYSKANPILLSIVKRENAYANPTAYSALSMCGTEDAARDLYDSLKNGEISSLTANTAKETIINISPDLAREWTSFFEDISSTDESIDDSLLKMSTISNQINSIVAISQDSIRLYILPSGERYHQEGCKFLDGREIEIGTVDAYRLYQPCQFCIKKIPSRT